MCGVNAAGTGRNAYPTLGLVDTPAGGGGLQDEVVLEFGVGDEVLSAAEEVVAVLGA